MGFFIPIVLVVGFIALRRCVCVIPHGYVAILEEYGKFVRILDPGLHICGVFSSLRRVSSSEWNDSARKITLRSVKFIDTRLRTFDLPRITCQTRDDVAVAVDMRLQARVVNARKWAYQSQDPGSVLLSEAQKAIRAFCASALVDDLYALLASPQAQDELSKSMKADVGIQVESFFVDEVSPPASYLKLKEQRQQTRLTLELDKERYIAEVEKAKYQAAAELEIAKEKSRASQDHLTTTLQAIRDSGCAEQSADLLNAWVLRDALAAGSVSAVYLSSGRGGGGGGGTSPSLTLPSGK